jgi:hypothetical protein
VPLQRLCICSCPRSTVQLCLQEKLCLSQSCAQVVSLPYYHSACRKSCACHMLRLCSSMRQDAALTTVQSSTALAPSMMGQPLISLSLCDTLARRSAPGSNGFVMACASR